MVTTILSFHIYSHTIIARYSQSSSAKGRRDKKIQGMPRRGRFLGKWLVRVKLAFIYKQGNIVPKTHSKNFTNVNKKIGNIGNNKKDEKLKNKYNRYFS